MKASLMILFILVNAAVTINAQSGDLPVFKLVSHPFMPPITSSGFFFTEDGLMWFSTARGLSSFDGSDVVYYSSTTETNSFRLNSITAIAEDSHHNLYIASPENIIYFNRKTHSFKPIRYTYTDTHTELIPHGRDIFIDDNEKVYIGHRLNGVTIYDPHAGKSEHYNIDRSCPDFWQHKDLNSISCFGKHATDSNKLWIGSSHGIYLFDKRTKQFSKNFTITNPGNYKYGGSLSVNDIDVEKMDVVDDSAIWFQSYTRGIGHYNIVTGNVKLYTHDAKLKTKDQYLGYIITRFAKWKPGKYFLGIWDPAPAIFNTANGQLEFLKITAGEKSFDAVSFVTTDKQGNLWVLNKKSLYISIPDHHRIRTIDVSKQTTRNYNSNELWGMYFDPATKLYYGGVRNSSGVYVFDTNFNYVKIIPSPLFKNFYIHFESVNDRLTKDGNGNIWSTGLDTYLLLPGAKKFEPLDKIIPSLAWIRKMGLFIDITAVKNGDLLLKNENGTTYFIDHKTYRTDTIKSVETTVDSRLNFKQGPVSYDSTRNLLYVNNAGNVSQYNLNSKTIRQIPFGVLFGSVKEQTGRPEIALDDRGRLWLWLPGIVRIIDPEKLICVDSIPFGTRGLVRSDIVQMRPGGKDYMLFCSLNGIVIYNYAMKESLLLDAGNGLSNNSIFTLQQLNGHLIIGQRNYIDVFRINDFSKYDFERKPMLNSIVADTQSVFKRSGTTGNDIIRLQYFQNDISFSFSALEFLFPERIEYAYQLTGVDNEWKYSNSFNRQINYSSLSPGKYLFRLQAQIEGGNWQAKPVEYTIIIVPAFWQTMWFALICVVAFFGLIILLIHLRIRQIRAKERQRISHEKDLLELESKALRAQMNPHFIFNSLNSIKSLINRKENDLAARYLTTFSKLIRTLFQNSDKREISLYEELQTCRLYTQIEKMRFGDKVDFIFTVDENIDLKDIKVPALILQPFIENAIWHGLVTKESGGSVWITITQTNNVIECRIDDDGIGRQLSQQYKSHYEDGHESKGISLTQSRLELDRILNDREDTIRVVDKILDDGTAGGTTVIITFKEIET